MNNERGITLIALVITIIIMIILAGVAISTIMDGEGLFGRTSEATKEYKIGQMVEAVNAAKTYLYMDNVTDGIEINISNLVEKIKEISNINDRDYTITISEEERTARIVDKKTGATVDIDIDEDGNITWSQKGKISRIVATRKIVDESGNDMEKRSVEKGKTIYIKFEDMAMEDGSNATITIDKEMPFPVTEDGVYPFTLTAEMENGETVQKTINVNIRQFVTVTSSFGASNGTGEWGGFPYETRSAGQYVQYQYDSPNIIKKFEFQHVSGSQLWQLGSEYVDIVIKLTGSNDGTNFEDLTDNLTFKCYHLGVAASLNSVDIDTDKSYSYYRLEFVSGGYGGTILARFNTINYCIYGINMYTE